jgi:hypothetical protein
VHGSEFVPPNRVVQEAGDMLITLHTVLGGDDFARGVVEHAPFSMVRWEKPLFGKYKVN